MKKYKHYSHISEKKINKIFNIIKNTKINLAELSFIWVNNLKFVNKIIIGVDNLNQIKNNLSIKKNKYKINLIKAILKIEVKDDKFLSPYRWKNV